MFIDNKYTRWYFKLINNAKINERFDIFEKHHIIPKCVGGSNAKENIIKLTIKEHYVCHKLLPKMVTCPIIKRKFMYALWCMSNGNNGRSRNKREKLSVKNSKDYYKLRNEVGKIRSVQYSGNGNHFFGKKHSQETKIKMSKNNCMKREEIRKKVSGPRPGFLPHNHYTGWSDEVKQKISKSLIGNKLTKETKNKMKLSKQNLIWINNGIEKPIQIFISLADTYFALGWKRGRGPKFNW